MFYSEKLDRPIKKNMKLYNQGEPEQYPAPRLHFIRNIHDRNNEFFYIPKSEIQNHHDYTIDRDDGSSSSIKYYSICSGKYFYIEVHFPGTKTPAEDLERIDDWPFCFEMRVRIVDSIPTIAKKWKLPDLLFNDYVENTGIIYKKVQI
ncbi:MAG: hypothetical protein GY853_14525 [PVC group bacterium]|nr:hypothetical protein [PVC group bacterium]